MKYNFMEQVVRFYDEELGWCNTILDFPNGFGLVIAASSYNFSSPKLNLENLEDYTAFEVSIVVRDDVGIYTTLSLDDCYGRISNDRLKAIVEDYSGIRELTYVPAAVVQEIADIVEEGNFLNDYEFMDKN